MGRRKLSRGFTLTECVAVVVILGVLAVIAVGRLSSSSLAQLQASRDSIVAALFSAQQLAMARSGQVKIALGGSTIDVRMNDTSVAFGGVQYPLTLPAGQSISHHTFAFNRLGFIDGAPSNVDVVLSQGAQTVTIAVSASGFSY